jgi:hypothetical protein
MKSLVRMLLALACLFVSDRAGAEPFVEHVEPPSVCRGQTNELTIVGSEVDRAIGLWTSLPAGKFHLTAVRESKAERSVFQVEVAADCPLGVYGLRVATEDGLSNLHLFVVDDLSPRSGSSDSLLELPCAVHGQLQEAAVDRYRFAAQAGQVIAFDVIASRLGHDADPLVTIYDADGRQIVQRDNDPGLFFDCSFEHEFKQAGEYTVEVRDARYLGSPHWRYLLRVGKFPVARVALPSVVKPGEKAGLGFPGLPGTTIDFTLPADQPPGALFAALRRPGDNASNWVPLLASPLASVVETEPNDAPDQATPAPAAPVILQGVFEQAGDKDYFAIDLKKGERLTASAETKSLNSAADVELIVVDPMGREIQRVDDLNLPGGLRDEASLTFNANQDGKYCLLVRELTRAFGPDYTYRVTVQPVAPRLHIVAEISAFTIPQDSYQSLPLTITRSDFAGPIELSLVGEPAGLKLEPNVIPAGENVLLCKLSASGAAPLGLQQLQIVGKGQAGETTIAARVTTQPLVGRQQVNVDLIKYALRDNQRTLPPSITDKLAVQITPPAPVSIDLASDQFTLPRYQQVAVPLQITRRNGYTAEIAFTALGTQQVGEESQGRRQVFTRFPVATADQPQFAGTIHSRSQANEGTERVDLCAIAKDGARSIYLKRSLLLAIKPAFEIEIDPSKLTLPPGGKTKVTLTAKRLPSFAGAINIEFTIPLGLALPETIVIPEGKESAEIEIAVAAESRPRRERIRLVASAPVNGFQEEPRPKDLEIEIKEPPQEPPAK